MWNTLNSNNIIILTAKDDLYSPKCRTEAQVSDNSLLCFVA